MFAHTPRVDGGADEVLAGGLEDLTPKHGDD
jgi:hypothetical protein